MPTTTAEGEDLKHNLAFNVIRFMLAFIPCMSRTDFSAEF